MLFSRLARLCRDHGCTAALAAGLGMSLGLAWWAAETVGDSAEAAAIAAALDRTAATAMAAEQFARHMLDDAHAFADLAQRWRELAEPARREEVALTMLGLVGQRVMPITNLAIADAEGRVRWHAAPWSVGYSVADRAAFQAHQAGAPGPLVSAPVMSRGTGETVIPVTVPLYDGVGAFAGITIAQFRPTDLSASLATLRDRPDDVLTLLRLEGDVLARSDGEEAMLGRRLMSAGLAARLAEAGTLAMRATSPRDGRELVLALRRVAGSNLVTGASTSVAAVLREARPARLLARGAAAAFSLLLCLGLAVGVTLLRAERLRREAAMLRAGRAEMERLHRRLPAVIFLRESAADGSSRLIYRAGDIGAVTGWTDGTLERVDDWHPFSDIPVSIARRANALALEEGSSAFEWRLRQPDGGWRPMVSRLERLTLREDGGGELVGYIRDLSAEHAARDELDRTLAAAPVVVFRAVIRPGDWLVTWISRSVERLTGWPVAALEVAGGLPALLQPWGRAMEATGPMLAAGEWSGDFHLRRRDGQRIMLRMTTCVMGREADGGATIVGYLADITAERDAEAKAIVSARLASLGEMSAGLAHELKQPLQAIALAANNVQTAVRRGDALAAEQRLERILAHVRRAGRVIENLRRFARGTEKGAPPVPVPLEEAIAGALSVLGAALRDEGVEVVTELAEPPPVALGQLVALEQVLTNLLLNARDALAQLPPGAPRRVTLRAEVAEAEARLVVADTGGGIDAAVLEHLFEPFVTTKGPERGTGLGLSICHGLIREMGGAISAANDDAGAVFRITLPAALEDAAERRVVAAAQ